MARFPLKEGEIVTLAEAAITGLTANAGLYPAPPVAIGRCYGARNLKEKEK